MLTVLVLTVGLEPTSPTVRASHSAVELDEHIYYTKKFFEKQVFVFLGKNGRIRTHTAGFWRPACYHYNTPSYQRFGAPRGARTPSLHLRRVLHFLLCYRCVWVEIQGSNLC